MTKQEEIREGIANQVQTTLVYYKELIANNQLYDAKDLDKGLASTILKYLHSQGVVIKVDRELPLEDSIQALEIDITDRQGLKHEWHKIDEEVMSELKATWAKIIKKQLAGYVAVEPLIKKE